MAPYLIGWLTVISFLGCGYTFQTSSNEHLAALNIHRVYLAPVQNQTYKSGIDSVLYNALLRTLRAHHQLQVVAHQEEADAIITSRVEQASYARNADAQVKNLNPANVGASLLQKEYVVSTEYMATLSGKFELRWVHPPAPPPEAGTGMRPAGQIWQVGLSRTKPFPSANQLEVPGTTAPLINESEFDRALSDISKSLAEDLHESMLALF